MKDWALIHPWMVFSLVFFAIGYAITVADRLLHTVQGNIFDAIARRESKPRGRSVRGVIQ